MSVAYYLTSTLFHPHVVFSPLSCSTDLSTLVTLFVSRSPHFCALGEYASARRRAPIGVLRHVTTRSADFAPVFELVSVVLRRWEALSGLSLRGGVVLDSP